VYPTTAEDVSKIIKAVRQHNIEFVVCCGGHATGAASSIEDGIVIDLRKMRKITVDTEKKTLAVEGGCLWVDVDTEAAKYGLASVGGGFFDR
jgi:FAD/FMN-containing dehydrogenase